MISSTSLLWRIFVFFSVVFRVPNKLLTDLFRIRKLQSPYNLVTSTSDVPPPLQGIKLETLMSTSYITSVNDS